MINNTGNDSTTEGDEMKYASIKPKTIRIFLLIRNLIKSFIFLPILNENKQ